jgi:Protein of unknown function (DUF1402)
MKKFIVRFTIISIISTPAFAQFDLGSLADTASGENPLIGERSSIKEDEPEHDKKWEPAWTKLCSYDDFCHRLKNPEDSSWYNPDRISVEAMRLHADDIKKASKLYGIDPRALTGAFLADLVIIPIYRSEIREHFIRRAASDKPSAVPGKYALGLVYNVAAQPVEPLAAKIEGRSVRPPQDVAKQILTPKGTIYYGAAVIREAQDIYKKYGISIEDQPDILATLYNLGKVEPKAKALRERIDRAKKMKAEGATDAQLAEAGLTPDLLAPRPNFFGLFTNKNMDAIEGILDPTKAPDSIKYPRADVGKCDAQKKQAEADWVSVQQKKLAIQPTAVKALSELKAVLPPSVPYENKAYVEVMTSPAMLAKVCPAPAKMSVVNSKTFRCVLNPDKNADEPLKYFLISQARPEGFFGLKKSDPKTLKATLRSCYIEQSTMRKGLSAQIGKCQTSGSKPFDFAQTLATKDSALYGHEAVTADSEKSFYAAMSISFECILGELPANSGSTAVDSAKPAGKAQ